MLNRTNRRTTILRPLRIGTILPTVHAVPVLMAQQVDVAVLALQTAGGGAIVLLAVDPWAGEGFVEVSGGFCVDFFTIILWLVICCWFVIVVGLGW